MLCLVDFTRGAYYFFKPIDTEDADRKRQEDVTVIRMSSKHSNSIYL